MGFGFSFMNTTIGGPSYIPFNQVMTRPFGVPSNPGMGLSSPSIFGSMGFSDRPHRFPLLNLMGRMLNRAANPAANNVNSITRSASRINSPFFNGVQNSMQVVKSDPANRCDHVYTITNTRGFLA